MKVLKKPPKTFEKTNQSFPKTYEQIIDFRGSTKSINQKGILSMEKTILVTSDTFGTIA